jgi:transposase
MSINDLPNNTDELKQMIIKLDRQVAEQIIQYEKKITLLEEELQFFKQRLFGRKSEKLQNLDDKNWPWLFNEAEMVVDQEAATENRDKQPLIRVKEHTRHRAGRKPLPANLPRKEIIHTLTEEERKCACGTVAEKIGEETAEKLDVIPAQFIVEKHIRYKYACRGCEGLESEGGAVKIAPPPPALIPKSIATPGLLAFLLSAKFEDGMPFYRIEKVLLRYGIELTRATMCFWMMQVADRLKEILELFKVELLAGSLIGIDETRLQVLKEPGRPAHTLSYMWVFRGGDPKQPVIIYHYAPSRAAEVPINFLGEYKGYIQTDDYIVYEVLGKTMGVVLVGCWAHSRRGFADVVKISKKSENAEKALSYIRKLYAVEKEAKELELDYDGVKNLRQRKAKPVLLEFKEWLEEIIKKVPPESKLGKAINYALGNWEKLIRYLEDGRIPIDNNFLENAIRPFVIGRKAWLFSDTPEGAHASAALYSLIETAKANGLEPYWYMRYIFEELPKATTREQIKNLLPQYIDRSKVKAYKRPASQNRV